VSEERWIVFPDWEHFEHRDVQRYETAPPWIKLYTRELDEDAYQELSSHRRAVLLDLRRLYAAKRGRLRVDTRSITRRLGVRVTSADIKALNHAGFLGLEASPRYGLDVDRDTDIDQPQKDEIVPLAEAKDVARARDAAVGRDDLDEAEISSAAQDEASTAAGDRNDGREGAGDPPSLEVVLADPVLRRHYFGEADVVAETCLACGGTFAQPRDKPCLLRCPDCVVVVSGEAA
jgi:hypothetical protein